ncbi:MAG: polyprenyl synthetase family protein [Verrucomicrobia bacterium]|jgi:geranylgeranyl diphosphate synthase type II|nr:MAG: polyprenyl synthetase family protein [Verrucomicrobiota bacterium]
MHSSLRYSFSSWVIERRKLVNAALREALPSVKTQPTTLHRAIRYSLFAGGKRLRPILCLAAAEACSSKGDPLKSAMPSACALECLHTYSLIHDDLPSMDNDDLRRGKPTCHHVFGEGIAILAGDALLTGSFELLAHVKPTKRYPLQVFLKEMAHAAGSQQLIAGQVADLEAEGKKWKLSDISFIHQRKTAALIILSLRLGAMSVNATSRQLDTLTSFGAALGLAYQIIDDILDVTQSREQLGKSSGKDITAQKATYPAVMGVPAALQEAEKQTNKAMMALKSLGKQAAMLELFARELLERTK